MTPAGDFYELAAPAEWQSIDFISDLHLHESEPANFLAWRHYLETSSAHAIFILGDLFEVWVGDDCLHGASGAHGTTKANATNPASQPNPTKATTPPAATNLVTRHLGVPFEDRCRRVLHCCAQQKPVFFMHGNRDFLVGSAALQACGMQLLPDPTVLTFGGLRYLLSHGDALCLADVDYQNFRRKVRSAAWQAEFLAHPLPQRQQMARDMRAQSEARKAQGGPWIDLDPTATASWMQAARADHMVHGHTHEGADHSVPAPSQPSGQGTRHVLCDWHAEATPPRAQVLRLTREANTPNTSNNAITVSAQRLPLGAAQAL